jgi:DNA-binding beta-propeller fold protein YncE
VLAALVAGIVPTSAQAMYASAYTTNIHGHNVFQFGIGAGGLLSALAPATVESGTRPLGVAISPDATSVYVADGGSEMISQYDVGPGGVLTPKTPATVPAGKEPESIAVNPDGRSVYVTNHQGESISQYDVGAGGRLSPKTPAMVATTGSTPGGIALSPDGKSAYVADSKGFVLQFGIGSGGSLSALAPAKVAAGTAPIAVAISPDGHSAYVANFTGGEVNGSVSQYDVGAGGLLSAKAPATVPVAPKPVGIAVSPDGRSVYVTGGEVNGRVSQYDVGASGALSVKAPAQVPAGAEPVGIALTPDGRSLYTADLHGYLAQFGVGAGSAISAKTPEFVFTGLGTEPSGLALLPDQGPIAAFSALPASAGSPTAFDGSASTDPDGSVARYDWSFGDGASAANTGPRPTHVYASAGSYTVRLTVADDAGCSTAFVFTGQTAYCNGGPQASRTTAIVVPPARAIGAKREAPVISAASLTNNRFRVAAKATAISARKAPLGTRFRFTLSAAASLQITITRSAPGLRRGRSCLAPSARLRRAHAKRCSRALTVGRLTRSNEPKGADSVAFSGRIGHRALSPRAYHAVLSASDIGGRSNAVMLSFTVVR